MYLNISASEGAAKYKETSNPFEASLVAAESGRRSASELISLICSVTGLVSSGVGFAIDVSQKKNLHSSFMQRYTYSNYRIQLKYFNIFSFLILQRESSVRKFKYHKKDREKVIVRFMVIFPKTMNDLQL